MCLFYVRNISFECIIVKLGTILYQYKIVYFTVAANWEGETETQPEKAEMPEEKKIETTDDGGGEDEGIEELSEEEDDEEEDEGGTTSVVKPKKIIQEQESGEKKDHVNVVFIGHVGQYI